MLVHTSSMQLLLVVRVAKLTRRLRLAIRRCRRAGATVDHDQLSSSQLASFKFPGPESRADTGSATVTPSHWQALAELWNRTRNSKSEALARPELNHHGTARGQRRR